MSSPTTSGDHVPACAYRAVSDAAVNESVTLVLRRKRVLARDRDKASSRSDVHAWLPDAHTTDEVTTA